MSDNEMWQDWRKASDERDEARQLAVDFRYRFEEAQKRNESYAIQFALDNDRIAQLERRIAELESEKLMSDGMIVGLNVALKIKDEEIEELTPPIIEGLAL